MKLFSLLLCLLLCSCDKPNNHDVQSERLTGVPTNVVGKWEGLTVRQVRRFGSELADSIWPARRDEWMTGKGFEFCPNGTLKVYTFTNATVMRVLGTSTFSLTATGQYTLANGVLEVRLNDEIASTSFPPILPTFPGYPLSERAQSAMRGAIYLALTNKATVGGTIGGTIGLAKVSKFKFE